MVGNRASTENIDERLIRLLGLDSEFEISYEEYIRHLKEVMIASRMSKSRYSSEETVLADSEFKRVRGKKGRFKIRTKKVKVTANGLGIGGFRKPLQAVQKRLLLAPSSLKPNVKTEDDIFSKIDDLLASILGNITQQNTELKKQTEKDRKNKENQKRKEKELGLEKVSGGIKKVVEMVTAPFRSILDKILNFFVMTFLGRAVFKLLEWFGNPDNKKKIDTIVKFLKDWWPAIVGGFVLFGTRFGKGIRILTRIAVSSIAKLAKATLAMLRFSRRNPAAAGAIAAGGWAAIKLTERAFSGGQPEQKLLGGGLLRRMFARGGRVSGPGGIDKVPAWLTHGEFVMSKGAVDRYGVSTLEAMNASGGGTNVPTFGPGGVHAEGGGFLNMLGRFLPGTGTVMAPRSDGPRDLQGIRQTMAGYQNKFLGIPMGHTSYPRGGSGQYSLEEQRRYASKSKTGSYFAQTNYANGRGYMPGMHGLYTPPRTPAVKPRDTITSQATGIGSKLSNISQQKQDIINQQLGLNDKTMSWGKANKVLGDQIGWSTQAEQRKQLKLQGYADGGRVPPNFANIKSSPKVKKITPLPSRKSSMLPISGATSKSASGSSGSTSQPQPPSFSSTHRRGTRSAEAVLGINKKK